MDRDKQDQNSRPLIYSIFSRLPQVERTGPAIAWVAAFTLSLLVVLLNLKSGRSNLGNPSEFEAGRVADRDIIAEQTVVFEDVEETRRKIEAEEKFVAAVFQFSQTATEELRGRWNDFTELAGAAGELSESEFKSRIGVRFPRVPAEIIDLLHAGRDRDELINNGSSLLNALFERGIYSMSGAEYENLNPDVVELIRITGSRAEQERVPLRSIVTHNDAAAAVSVFAESGAYPPLFVRVAPQLLLPFIGDNVFYSSEETNRRIAEVRLRTEPVMRTIEQGKRVIRKGFIISEDDILELHALRMNYQGNNITIIFADVIFLLLYFGSLSFFCGKKIIGRNLTDREAYLVSALSAVYLSGSVLVRNIPLDYLPASVVVPTALMIMLPAILIHSRLALFLAIVLPLGAFITGSFNSMSFIFAVVSGVAAAYSIQGAEKRMELLKAGLKIAAANITAMTAILLWQRIPAYIFPQALFWAAFNGVASGMLVLGFLPPLEQGLNAATSFRLIELSDLNAPVLRQLFSVAPGTYSHSIMVANLAEAACHDIGANSLLARVGAYYHDLGKMENHDYFVENQTDHNRHDEMAPRLSAVVIRNHVKLGIEKTKQLGFPNAVIDIVGEHHGNSVITWFYDKALKQESDDPKKSAVEIEDYSYPGNPPRSRESAVVMLADVSEAAVRTIDKPNGAKIEKFIQELFSRKVEHGQLAWSELTFRDLEIIKNAFVRVLVGHYHSRIEYPKVDETKKQADE